MPGFSGTDESSHFLFLETPEDSQNSLQLLYKLFVSTVRFLEVRGIKASLSLFPNEYTTTEGPQAGGIQESNIYSNCKTYANRSAAEKTWPEHARILEIGVGNGNHAVSIIQSCGASTYTGIDINFSQLLDSSKSSLNNLSTSTNVTLIQGDSIQNLTALVQEGKQFDVIYVDANHWFYYVSQEIELASKLVATGGLIVVNDYLPWFIGSMEPCGVQKATNLFLAAHPEYKVVYYAINDCDLAISSMPLSI